MIRPMKVRLLVISITALVLVAVLAGCSGPLVPQPEPVPAAPAPEPTPKLTTLAPELQQGEEYYINGERYVLPTFEELERERDDLVRNYPKIVKGVWEPATAAGHHLIKNSLPELRDLGVNTIHVIPMNDYINGEHMLRSVRLGAPGLGSLGFLMGEKAERDFIDRVVKAKKAGFAVSIMPGYSRQNIETITDLDAFDEYALQQARKWAQIAEEYQVEYFSPLNEYDNLMFNMGLSGAALVERVNSWNRKVLDEIRPIFKGKIILKVSSHGLDSYSAQSALGYDILAISFTSTSRLEKLRESIQEKFNDAQTVAKRDNVEWMVGEFFQYIEGRSEEERVEIFRLVFEEYQRTLKGENKPIGFTFFGWEMSEGRVKGSEIVPFLKQFFYDISSAEQEANAQQK